MTNGIKRYRPASELKDHHDLIRIAAGIRTSDRRPAGLRKRMLHHVTELLKLFAQDPTLGVPDPSREAEERRRAEEKRLAKEQRARSRALEDQVRAAEAAAEANGTVPSYTPPHEGQKLLEDARAFVGDRLEYGDFYRAHPDVNLRAARIIGSFKDGETFTEKTIAERAGSKRIARGIVEAFERRGVTLLPRLLSERRAS